MKHTQQFAQVESFHSFECHNPESLMQTEPIEDLDYQHDLWYDICHSVIDPNDIPSLQEQLDRGIPMNYEFLLHFMDRDHDLVKLILERNNFVHDWDGFASLMVYVARIQRFQFNNIHLGNLLFQHIVNCGISNEEIHYHMVDQQSDDSKDYGQGSGFDLEGFIFSFKPSSKATLLTPRHIDPGS
jgi:hypothetical protein